MNDYADWLGRMPTDETGYQIWVKEGQQHGWSKTAYRYHDGRQ